MYVDISFTAADRFLCYYIYTYVLNEFNFAPEDAVYVGDSDVDIMTAKNSKMPCISVTWGFRDKKFLLENGATILINAPSEIYNHLA